MSGRHDEMGELSELFNDMTIKLGRTRELEAQLYNAEKAVVVSRLASGWICDRIGGRRTLLLGSSLQALALVLFLPFDGLASLYILSALFGLFQGGIVPAYAVIIREFFPPEEAGVRVATVLMATVFGMALGGWMSGMVFDLTGSYQTAFLNGILWNLLNMAIAVGLLRRPGRPAYSIS